MGTTNTLINETEKDFCQETLTKNRQETGFLEE